MDRRAVTCPRCDSEIGTVVPRRGAGVMEHLCAGCAVLLRVRYFWGEVIDAEEFFVDADDPSA